MLLLPEAPPVTVPLAVAMPGSMDKEGGKVRKGQGRKAGDRYAGGGRTALVDTRQAELTG